VTLVLAFFFSFLSRPAQAEPYAQGAETCQSCHQAEYQVWGETKHFAAFREVHRNPKAQDILLAVGGDANMKRNATCTLCHYTMVQEGPGAPAAAKSGPSCERCHGASSDWLSIHNDYGGPTATKESETPEHKTERIANAKAAGWIASFMKYDIASNCMECHGLAHPSLDGATLAKMLGAGHPLNPEFEFVQYSQGSVRHRFYPPDTTVNAETTPVELARLFVTGQAAKLVSAAQAQAKSDNPDYQAAQKKRADDAVQVLSAVKSVPEAQALVASPTDENARALVDAIADKDLSAEVGALLPDQASYK
jgi:hypothetical protein